MKSLIKRIIDIENECKDFNRAFYTLFLGAEDMPFIQHGVAGERYYFRSVTQFERFKEIANNFTPEKAKETVIFPIYFSGEPDKAPRRRKVITNWSIDLKNIEHQQIE